MKVNLQKGMEQLNNAVGQVAEKSKKVAVDTKENMQSLAVRIQDENTKALLKKFNPVFPEEYTSENFSLPNMIVIVDDVVRKDIEVCRGSIGWKSSHKDMEIFHLYDEAIEFSGLQFIPIASCDSVYYVDSFDRKKYIKLDIYFDRMQNSKLAELEHIAFSLGAKRYTVEMQESSLEERSESKKAFEGVKLPFGGKKALSSSGETNMEELSHTSKKVLKTAEFTNGAQPVEPTLKWFKYDDEINNLIKMRLSGNLIDNSMKKYSLSLSGSSSSSIGASTAVKIEAAANKLEAGAGYDIASQVKKESSSKLIFNIEF